MPYMTSMIAWLRFLYVQRVRGFEPPGEPHLESEVVSWLYARLAQSSFYLEFGSGGSTLLANRLGVRTLSIESDRFYAAVVRRALASPEIVETIVPNMGLTREWGMPIFFRSKKGRRYVHAPFQRPMRGFPDLILVDGRYRVACVLESCRQAWLSCVKTTVLLDDYEGRHYGRMLEPILGKPDRKGRAAIFTAGETPVSEEEVCRHLADPS